MRQATSPQFAASQNATGSETLQGDTAGGRHRPEGSGTRIGGGRGDGEHTQAPSSLHTFMFVYDGGILSPDQSAAIVLPQAELRSWAWCTNDELEDRLPAHMFRRTRKALQARANATTLYLENGHSA